MIKPLQDGKPPQLPREPYPYSWHFAEVRRWILAPSHGALTPGPSPVSRQRWTLTEAPLSTQRAESQLSVGFMHADQAGGASMRTHSLYQGEGLHTGRKGQDPDTLARHRRSLKSTFSGGLKLNMTKRMAEADSVRACR